MVEHVEVLVHAAEAVDHFGPDEHAVEHRGLRRHAAQGETFLDERSVGAVVHVVQAAGPVVAVDEVALAARAVDHWCAMLTPARHAADEGGARLLGTLDERFEPPVGHEHVVAQEHRVLGAHAREAEVARFVR